MTAKLQDLTSPDWKVMSSNEESIDISYESDSGQLVDSVEDDCQSMFSRSYNRITTRNLDGNDHNYSKVMHILSCHYQHCVTR